MAKHVLAPHPSDYEDPWPDRLQLFQANVAFAQGPSDDEVLKEDWLARALESAIKHTAHSRC